MNGGVGTWVKPVEYCQLCGEVIRRSDHELRGCHEQCFLHRWKYPLGTESGTSVTTDSDDPKNTGIKPEDIRKVVIGTDEVFRKSRFR